MSKYTVEITDTALMYLCVAGLESYCVPREPKETYGLLWGAKSLRREDETYYRVDHVFTDIEAKRKVDWVRYNMESLRLKQEIVGACWPTQAFLGDFHTHPCGQLNEIENACRLSEGDRVDVEEGNCEFWLEHELSVNLLLTIVKLRIHGHARPKRRAHHIIEWTLHGYYRLRLSAYVVDRFTDAEDRNRLFLSPREAHWNDGGEEEETIESREHEVWLDVPSVLGSSSFNRAWV